jgi:hypothetical protein
MMSACGQGIGPGDLVRADPAALLLADSTAALEHQELTALDHQSSEIAPQVIDLQCNQL